MARRGLTAAIEALQLASGAEARVTNGIRSVTAVLANGGRAEPVEGTWSATNEWLVRRLAPDFPALGFVEVRYRVKSWRRLELCVEDARAAIAAAVAGGAIEVVLVGFSMGGAVCVSTAAEPSVTTVVGLAPWLPDRLSVEPLGGRRFAVVHGSLDRALPGVPGVSPELSRRGYERALRVGLASGDYTVLRGALHGAAVRAPWGLAALPFAGRWAAFVAAELERASAA